MSAKIGKVAQSPCDSVKKSEPYANLMVLWDFPEPLNIVTNSQYPERVVLHIETTELIPDNLELSLLFIQLQQVIRYGNHPLYVTHIRSHKSLPGSLAQVMMKLSSS